MAPETSQTLDRGLQVLRALAARPRGSTVTSLAELLEVNRTVVYRLVATLERHDLARRDESGRLYAGLGVLALARSLQPLLRDLATPVLSEVADRLGSTAHFTVAEGGQALTLAAVEPTWTTMHVAFRVGARGDLDQNLAGQAIIAGREPESESAERWVQGDAGLAPGMHGLAAPVLGVSGLEASLGVVSLAPLDPSDAGPLIVGAADEVARRLR